MQLAKRKQLYQWKKLEDLYLPSCVQDMPHDEGFELVKNVQFHASFIKTGIHAKLAGLIMDVDHLHGYEEYAKLIEEPEIRTYEFSRWTSDVEFGRQILNAVNPVMIRKCETLPAKFPVTDEMVQSSLHRGLTLAQEMQVCMISIKHVHITTVNNSVRITISKMLQQFSKPHSNNL